MAVAVSRSDAAADLAMAARAATTAVEALLGDAPIAVRAQVTRDGQLSGRAVDREQRATHGIAWLATYVEVVRQLAAYAERMQTAGRFSETEELLVRIGLAEYLGQTLRCMPMSHGG